jgi:hypothetical protein
MAPFKPPAGSRPPPSTSKRAIVTSWFTLDRERLRRRIDERRPWRYVQGPSVTDRNSCYTCKLGIEMRYSVSSPKSKGQGYWSHLDNVDGIAAGLDHDALR